MSYILWKEGIESDAAAAGTDTCRGAGRDDPEAEGDLSIGPDTAPTAGTLDPLILSFSIPCPVESGSKLDILVGNSLQDPLISPLFVNPLSYSRSELVYVDELLTLLLIESTAA